MDFKIVWKVIRKKLCERWILFASLALILICETVLSLLVPEVMRGFIDGLGNRGTKWLVLCALGYCLAVLLKGGVSVLNSWLGEKAGRELSRSFSGSFPLLVFSCWFWRRESCFCFCAPRQ